MIELWNGNLPMRKVIFKTEKTITGQYWIMVKVKYNEVITTKGFYLRGNDCIVDGVVIKDELMWWQMVDQESKRLLREYKINSILDGF